MATVRSFGVWAICLTYIVATSPLPSAAAATSEVSLRGAGSTFSATLYKDWIETYHRERPAVSPSAVVKVCAALLLVRSILEPAMSRQATAKSPR